MSTRQRRKHSTAKFVTFEADHRPASGADVYWFDNLRLADPHCQQDLELLGMGAKFFERNGRHFVSDSNGIARVPTTGGMIQVIAMTSTHFGMTTIERESESKEPIAIGLRQAFEALVLVRSARTQEPIPGVAVVSLFSDISSTKIGGLTNEHGVARLWPLFQGTEPSVGWYVQLAGIFREEQRVLLDPEAGGKLLELLLPDSAPAQVRIVDDSGELCPLSGTLQLGWNDKEGDPLDPIEVRITEGIADLARVEFDLPVHMRAKLLGTSEEPMSVFTFDSTEKNRARFDLALQRPLQELRARFTDLEGKPLAIASATCSVTIRHDDATIHKRTQLLTRADGSGVFRFDSELGEAGPCTVAVAVETASGTRLGGVFHAALKEKFTDIGELQLAPAQPLFAGRVLDRKGRAVRGARIDIFSPSSEDEANVFRLLECKTDEEGHFELSGWAEGQLFIVRSIGSGTYQSEALSLGDFAVEIRGR